MNIRYIQATPSKIERGLWGSPLADSLSIMVMKPSRLHKCNHGNPKLEGKHSLSRQETKTRRSGRTCYGRREK